MDAKDFEEFDRRWNDYKSGTAKTYTLAEVKKSANELLKTLKKTKGNGKITTSNRNNL